MHKHFAILIFLTLLPVWFNSTSETQAHLNLATTPTPEPASGAEVKDIFLDRTSLTLKCPWARDKDSYCYGNNAIVKVSVTAESLSNETFYYVISDGQITGQGTNVVWDLTGAKPGKHSISVGIGSDYIIHGKTLTKTVMLAECDTCDPPCACPVLEITGANKPAKPGDTVIFSARVSGAEKSITYQWNISGGEIIAGQNSSQIMVKTSANKSIDKIAATVQIGRTDPACNCPNTASADVTVENKKP